MKKSAPIAFGIIGTLSFLISAIRPQLVAEGVRFVRWNRRWS
jgi:hypothetical protein